MKRFDRLGFVSPKRALPLDHRAPPSWRDCFVALRALRNDGVTFQRHIRVIASEAKQSRVTPADDVGSEISTSSSFLRMLLSVRHRCRAAHPGGLSCQIVGFEPFAPPTEGSGAPKFAGAERRARWSALRQDRSRQRTGWPAHNADRRAFRRSTAAFSLDLRTAFWERTGATLRRP